MNIKYIDFGEILAWIAAILLFALKIIDFQIFILFVLLKIKVKINFR